MISAIDIINNLKNEHRKKELQQSWITHLWLFGSVQQWVSNNDSDIDLAYEFDAKKAQHPWWVMHAYRIISECIQWYSIDLVSASSMRSQVRKTFDLAHTQIF